MKRWHRVFLWKSWWRPKVYLKRKNPNKINEMLTLQPRYIIFIKTVPISIPTSAAIWFPFQIITLTFWKNKEPESKMNAVSSKKVPGAVKYAYMKKKTKWQQRGEGMKLEHAEQLPGFIKRNSENTNRHRAADEKSIIYRFLAFPLAAFSLFHLASLLIQAPSGRGALVSAGILPSLRLWVLRF